MILGFKTHFDDGTPTDFERKVLSGEKIHTIRQGKRWRSDMNAHCAVNIRTKNYRQFALKHVKTVQYINIKPDEKSVYVSAPDFSIRKMSEIEIETLAKNDGLTIHQFWTWFNKPFLGQILHFTTLRY